MTDLSRDHVAAMIAALGVDASEEDLAEITHRLNGFLDALAPLSSLPLHEVEPWAALPGPEGYA
jgi:hypothetical protein